MKELLESLKGAAQLLQESATPYDRGCHILAEAIKVLEASAAINETGVYTYAGKPWRQFLKDLNVYDHAGDPSGRQIHAFVQNLVSCHGRTVEMLNDSRATYTAGAEALRKMGEELLGLDPSMGTIAEMVQECTKVIKERTAEIEKLRDRVSQTGASNSRLSLENAALRADFANELNHLRDRVGALESVVQPS